MPAFGILEVPTTTETQGEAPHPLPIRPVLFQPREGEPIEVCILHRMGGVVLASCAHLVLIDQAPSIVNEDLKVIRKAFDYFKSDAILSFDTLPEPLRETFMLGEPRVDWDPTPL